MSEVFKVRHHFKKKIHGDRPRLLILHISEKHKEDSNVKNLAKKQKNQKTPCGECGKLYSDSGLRAHMIRVSIFLKTIQLT